MKSNRLLPTPRLLLSLILFLIPSQLGYHFWPEWAYVLGRRVDYLSPALYFTDILIILYISVSLPGVAKLFNYFKIKKRILLYAGILAVTVLIASSVHPAVSAIFLIRLLFYFLFGILLATQNRIPYRWFIAGTLLSGAVGLLQVARGTTAGGLFYFLGERTFTTDTIGITLRSVCFPFRGCIDVLRAYGTTAHPNILGGMAAVAAILTAGSVIGSRLKIMILFLLLLILVATASASAALALGIALMWSAGKQYQKIFRPLRLLFMTVSVTLIITAGMVTFSDIFRGNISYRERIQQLPAAVAMFRSRPVTGIGIGNYVRVLPAVARDRAISFLQPVHSAPFLVLAETGILGSLVFFWLVILYLRYTRNSPLFPLIIVLGVISLADHYLLTISQGLLLTVFCLAACVNAKKSV